MIHLIRKRLKDSEAAATEFQLAKREDLQEKEIKQILVLKDFLPTNSMDRQELVNAVQKAIGKIRGSGGAVSQRVLMKTLVGPGGMLEGRNVDNRDVVKLVVESI